MHNIGGRCIQKMISATHVQSDDQNLECLKLHENGGGYEAVYDHSTPIQIAKAVVHFLNRGYVIKGYAGLGQPFQIHGVCTFG